MTGIVCDADERYQTAGKRTHAPSCLRGSAPSVYESTERHGTYTNDRPPFVRIISWGTGEPHFWVCAHGSLQTCAALTAECVPTRHAPLPPDEWQSSWPASVPDRSPPATVSMNGYETPRGMAAAQSRATPARERGRRFAPTCVCFGGCISNLCISTWPCPSHSHRKTRHTPADPTDVRWQPVTIP